MFHSEKIFREIQQLQEDLIRAQPIDANHKRLTQDVIRDFVPLIDARNKTVLDIGCGQGVAKLAWESAGYEWTGVTASNQDCRVLAEKGWRYYKIDMHEISDCSFGVVYARHVLEHSPYPTMALQAWRKIAPWMIVVVPEERVEAYIHIGHISLFPMATWKRYFQFLGLDIIRSQQVPYNNPPQFPQGGSEYRFLLKTDMP